MPKPDAATKHKHESYGLLSFNRSGQQRSVPLFGAHIRHGHTISLVLHRAEEHRHLASSTYMTTERLIEVEMSEAQFGRLITNMNTGGGVPVTIRFDGQQRCAEPPVYSERQRIREELRERVEGVVSDFDADIEEIEQLFGDKGNVGKTARADILKKLRSMQQRLRNNVPFVHERFDEAVEETVTAAMAEIEAHVTQAALKLGVGSLGGVSRANLLGEGEEGQP